MLSESFLQSAAEEQMKLVAMEEAELELEEMSNLDKKSGSKFIEVINEDDRSEVT